MIQKLYLDTQIVNAIKNITPDFVQAELDKNIAHRRDTQEQHMPYVEESRMLLCVKNGDVNGFRHTIEQMGKAGAAVGLTGDDAVQQSRTIMVAAVALYTRAAIEGGLGEAMAYDLSDAYLKSTAHLQNPDKLMQLTFWSGLDFATRVRRCKAARSLPVKKCCDYVGDHLHEKITLTDLARHCGRTEGYVSGCFKRQLGVSPIEYVRGEKLEAARKALLTSDVTISEIGMQYGFCSHSNFTLHFQRKFGVSPSQYRVSTHSVAWRD